MNIRLEWHGRSDEEARLPALFASTTTRSSSATTTTPHGFLPDGLLEPVASFEIGPTTRSEATPLQHTEVDADHLVVLELSDGSIFITRAGDLGEALKRKASLAQGLEDHGVVRLESLRGPGDAATRDGLLDTAGGLISRVFTFKLCEDVVGDGVMGGYGEALTETLKEMALDEVIDKAITSTAWVTTRALMWAIEKRLPCAPGLYRWSAEEGLDTVPAPPPSAARPMLVFVHDLGSHTEGSFGDLARQDRNLLASLAERYPGGVFGFQHRTLSHSPIDNALDLLDALPEGACVSLVTHGRGGLVGDLLCVTDLEALTTAYRHPTEHASALPEAAHAHAGQRRQLARLAQALARKRIVVPRYVRVACPAAGTRLLGGRLDLYLSGVLWLIGRVPFFLGSPFYDAFRRVVLEVVKGRADPRHVPGIEAMLPDAPLARLLHGASVREGVQMAVIAGDREGRSALGQLGAWLTDRLLFENTDNDLMVDTPAMLAGIAPQAGARVKLDRSDDVSHFQYFANGDTRSALLDWLRAEQTAEVAAFVPLPSAEHHDEVFRTLADTPLVRDATAVSAQPVVVVIPDLMASHLTSRPGPGKPDRRLWLDPDALQDGGLARLAWKPGDTRLKAGHPFGPTYGPLCLHLARSHRVAPFAYDWRQPLDVLGDQLAERLDALLAETDQPVRLLAHGMGGLVVRAAIARRRAVVDALMERPGARLVLLGVPHRGSFAVVETLLGKGEAVRALALQDPGHDLAGLLRTLASMPGLLQCLPPPPPTGAKAHRNWHDPATWKALRPKIRDDHFGQDHSPTPTKATLDAARWLWDQPQPPLPEAYADHTVQVLGAAPWTPCGLEDEGQGHRACLVGSPEGDGVVTWASSRLDGVAATCYAPVAHGDLTTAPELHDALADLLSTGRTSAGLLDTPPPGLRSRAGSRLYDADPPALLDQDALQRRLLGGTLAVRVPSRLRCRLQVSVHAMDLRFLARPILLGHYQQDPIAGPQALVDREMLKHGLTERYNLGLYPGPLGTATAVIRAPNEIERARGSLSGAIVTGLGRYDQSLTPGALTEAVRAGALRYLLHVVDVLGPQERALDLATLLIGYNSSAHLSVDASVEALVRGVLEANERFHETTGLRIHIADLRIVELYRDTAISAAYALRWLAADLVNEARRLGIRLTCAPELTDGQGVRPRLFEAGDPWNYWPRLMVTRVDPPESNRDRDRDQGRDHDGQAPIADRLRFLYVGQRARAEAEVQQRQPGLIEQLVRRQIHTCVWQEDFGRTLFQLMVPHNFKDTARQLARVVLVVDRYTANLPWELMMADDPTRRETDRRPLALRTAMVRQLASTTYRQQVRQTIGHTALVIGNPSLARFLDFFPGDGKPSDDQPPPTLDGAELEARAIAAQLQQMGYTVTSVIGAERMAHEVLIALYRQPWRLLHISAHGAFDLRHRDGRRRSGVLLSDGVLITAAEIQAMEVVPELVFLNCCHLGVLDSVQGRDGNRLAASVARELIEIGVRCVVVAGWAVSDDQAQRFGETFYTHLLLRGRNFGDAVFEARKATWNARSSDITWGAFQAYGDPGWLADPRTDDSARRSDETYTSVHELLDDLARQQARLARLNEQPANAAEKRRRQKLVKDMVHQRSPSAWRQRPDVQSALAATWRDMGEFELARAAFLQALQTEDQSGSVPVRDIEQLAHVEVRWAGQLGETTDPDQHRTAHALIDTALRRLDQLDLLVRGHEADAPRVTTSERAALRGSAYKRRAVLLARQLAMSTPSRDPTASPASDPAAPLREALAKCAEAYHGGDAGGVGEVATGKLTPYNTLNCLQIQALLPGAVTKDERQRRIVLARQCRDVATRSYRQSNSPWDAVTPADAILTEMLVDGRFGAPDTAEVDPARDAIDGYRQALIGLTLTPVQRDSVAGHLRLLAEFAGVLARHALAQDRPPLTAIQRRLRQVADASPFNPAGIA